MRRASVVLLFVAALVLGTIADRAPANPPLTIGSYRVLVADFHLHSSLLSAGMLAPWDMVTQAARQHLDVIAITPHNQLMPAKVARGFAEAIDGPLVIVGEEVRGPAYHLIALGIDRSVSWRLPAAEAIAQVHAQGGFTIAAHPAALYWPAYDAAAMAVLDGAEVCHPSIYRSERHRADMRAFYARTALTAIGSSDFHGMGRMGLCRTYIFARDASEAAVFEALRARHTVVYDERGNAYGDPELIRLAGQDGRLRAGEAEPPPSTALRIARLLSVAAMLVVALFAVRA